MLYPEHVSDMATWVVKKSHKEGVGRVVGELNLGNIIPHSKSVSEIEATGYNYQCKGFRRYTWGISPLASCQVKVKV